jgi:hypothetical protein
VIDHVNNLKLQHLVELSKLGDRCAEIEEEIADWLHRHDVVFDGHTIPFVLMPHFVSPRQVSRVRRAVERSPRLPHSLQPAPPGPAPPHPLHAHFEWKTSQHHRFKRNGAIVLSRRRTG